jgi:hypothetical protein
MRIDRQHNLAALFLLIALTSCSSQNWYKGAQSYQQARCMNEPVSEYENCVQQSDGNYDEYSKSRQQLQENQNK